MFNVTDLRLSLNWNSCCFLLAVAIDKGQMCGVHNTVFILLSDLATNTIGLFAASVLLSFGLVCIYVMFVLSSDDGSVFKVLEIVL